MTNTTQHPSVAEDAKIIAILADFAVARNYDEHEDLRYRLTAHIDTLLAAAREEYARAANAEVQFADEQKERAEKAEAALAVQKLRADNNEGMAVCMADFRDNMIRVGVIDASVAPMFMTEAIGKALAAAQPRAQAEARQQIPDGWPTDNMVIRGAEELHDALRQQGVDHDFDVDLRGTEIQQGIAEAVFKAMLAAAPAAPQQEG